MATAMSGRMAVWCRISTPFASPGIYGTLNGVIIDTMRQSRWSGPWVFLVLVTLALPLAQPLQATLAGCPMASCHADQATCVAAPVAQGCCEVTMCADSDPAVHVVVAPPMHPQLSTSTSLAVSVMAVKVVPAPQLEDDHSPPGQSTRLAILSILLI